MSALVKPNCAEAGPLAVSWKKDLCDDGPTTGGQDDPASTCGWDTVPQAVCHGLRPTYQWILGTNDQTSLHVAYIAAYQYSTATNQWHRVDSASFNWDGQYPAQDTNLKNLRAADAEMFMPPHPGGSVNWLTGYTPHPTMPNNPTGGPITGVAPPGMLFVMKNEGTVNQQFSWYVVSQRTLNLGAYAPNCMNPSCQAPGGSSYNCWGWPISPTVPASGEIDILEGLFYGGDVKLQLKNSAGCMMKAAGQEEALMFKPPTQSPLWAAVVDKRGVTAYLNPTWDGLTATTAGATLPQKPTSAEKTVHLAQTGLVMDRSVDTNQLQAVSESPPGEQSPPNYRELYWAKHGGGPMGHASAQES